MLYELLYTSEASWEISPEDLLALLKQARAKNKRLKVTGLLIYYKKEFMQLIEGDAAAIKELWETIRKDERHFDAKVIFEGPIHERGFQDWSMAFHNIEDLNLEQLQGFSDLLTQGLNSKLITEKPSTARNVMAIIKNHFLMD